MNDKLNTYSVEVWELVATTLTVKARTAREAGASVKAGVWPSGTYRRTIKRVELVERGSRG